MLIVAHNHFRHFVKQILLGHANQAARYNVLDEINAALSG